MLTSKVIQLCKRFHGVILLLAFGGGFMFCFGVCGVFFSAEGLY